jgi:hypothetical protein
MHAKKPATKPSVCVQRRDFIQLLGAGALGIALASAGSARAANSVPAAAGAPVPRPGRKQLQGLFPIGSTPVTGDDKLDLESLAAQVTFCNRAGVHGFVWPMPSFRFRRPASPTRRSCSTTTSRLAG